MVKCNICNSTFDTQELPSPYQTIHVPAVGGLITIHLCNSHGIMAVDVLNVQIDAVYRFLRDHDITLY